MRPDSKSITFPTVRCSDRLTALCKQINKKRSVFVSKNKRRLRPMLSDEHPNIVFCQGDVGDCAAPFMKPI